MSRLSEALADRYTIERELGAGGMATVYLAHDLRHDRQVAIKVLRPELAAVIGAERFLSEIKTTANLQHPHILPLFDSGEADGQVFYVMPYVEGESIRDLLARERQLPVEDAVRIATQVAQALDYAHRHGVVHRDIKPENIMLHDGSAVVADFGIALAVSRSDGGTRMTETGMSLGTPHYMAPEQAMGEREITARSDVYALGCVLYEMLAGEPPFTGPTAQAIIARVVTEEPRSLTVQRKTVPPNVAAAVVRALQKLPADRFATAAQFAEALNRPGYATETLEATATMAASRRGRRQTVLRMAPWGLAAILAGLAAWVWLRSRPEPPVSWQYISVGDTLSPTVTGPSLALAPDGRSLVFKDERQNGLLWLKRWDRLDPVPIPGTERANAPAFSPDGSWVAFLADGRLKKVRSEGGGAMTLADTATTVPAGGYKFAWLDDGTLIYPAARQDQLLRVSANGGQSTVVLADSALRGFGLLNLEPLPGARGVLFTPCISGCVTIGLHVLDLRTGTQKLLLANIVSGWYLPDGYLMYATRAGTIFGAKFDLDKLEITGPAIPLLEDVRVTAGNAFLAWSSSGNLVYLRGRGVTTDLEVVRVSRMGVPTIVDSSWTGGFNSFALSPDGRRLAVGTGLTAGGLSIWLKQLDRGTFGRLSFGGQDRRPVWSPDGRQVAFIRDSTAGGNVFVRAADGSGGDRLLGHLDRQIQEVEWSPDGRWLVVRTDNGTAGAGDLVGIPLSGDTAAVPLVASPFTELHPAVSPDGAWLAYVSNESGENEVYVRSFPQTAGGRWQVSNGGGSQPRWSSSGKELFYVDVTGRLVSAHVQTRPVFQVTGLESLFSVTDFLLDDFHQSYAVTPDGTGFYFLRRARTERGAESDRVVLVEHWFSDVAKRMEQ